VLQGEEWEFACSQAALQYVMVLLMQRGRIELPNPKYENNFMRKEFVKNKFKYSFNARICNIKFIK